MTPEDEKFERIAQRHIADLKKSSKAIVEDAAIRDAHKVMAEFAQGAHTEVKVEYHTTMIQCPHCDGSVRVQAQPYPDNFIHALMYDVAKRDSEAQQQEPVALPEKIYEFVPTPEPVKWHHPECEGQCIACLIEQVVQEAYGSQGLGYLQRHLTSPPQRKPLTDEQIWDEVKAADLDWQTGWSLDEDASNRYITFARAIEAAHGIKENT